MRTFGVVYVFLVAFLTVAGLHNHYVDNRSEVHLGTASQPTKPEPGPDRRPSDYFHLQRAYPGAEIPDVAWQRGMAQSRAKRTAERGGAAWELAGPTNIGGRITAIGYHEAEPLRIFAGAADGGIFRSEDFGTSWTPLFDDQTTLSIGAIAMHPQDADALLVGTGEANSSGDSYPGTGVYRSTNAGQTWEALGLEATHHIGRIVYNPLDPHVIYVAALGRLFSTSPERGVYRSQDGGDSWQLVHSVNDSTGCVDLAIHPTQPNIVYAAMWERIRRTGSRQSGGPGSGIWRSADGGDSWSLLTTGLPASGPTIGRIGLAIAPSAPSTLYAIYADHPGAFLGIFKSTNGGDTWSQVNDGSLSNMYSSFGWYFGNIRVAPNDPDRVVALGLDNHQSTNGGASWNVIGSSIHVDQHDLVISAAKPSLYISGNDGGIYFSLNSGASWQKSFNLPISQFYAITVDFQLPHRLYGGTQDNSTMRTLTGALDDWDIILGGDGFYTIVDPTNSNTLYAEWQFGGLSRSFNGGASFSSATAGTGNDRRNWSTPVVMDPENPNTLYYGTYRVYRSTDQAGFWTAISPDLSDGPGPGNLTFGTLTTIDVAPSNTSVIAAGLDDSNVWITVNGASSWTNVSAALPNRWCTRVAFDPIDEAILYATFSGYRENFYAPHVFRSTNFGASWTDISSDLPDLPVNDIIVDPEDTATLYVATDGGVFASADLGGSWSSLGSGLPLGSVHDIHLHNPTRKLVAGTHGRSMWTLNLDDVAALREPATGAPSIALALWAAPNPFRTATELTAEVGEHAHARVRIYDATGRWVRTLFDGDASPGTLKVRWDGRRESGDRLATGVYFGRLEVGDAVATQRIVLAP